MTWLEKRGGAAATVISKVSEAERMIEDQEVVVIGFFADLECAEAEQFREAADGVDEAFFLLTSEADLRKAYSVAADKTVVLFKDWDERRVVYEGDMTKSEVRILRFWHDERAPFENLLGINVRRLRNASKSCNPLFCVSS